MLCFCALLLVLFVLQTCAVRTSAPTCAPAAATPAAAMATARHHLTETCFFPVVQTCAARASAPTCAPAAATPASGAAATATALPARRCVGAGCAAATTSAPAPATAGPAGVILFSTADQSLAHMVECANCMGCDGFAARLYGWYCASCRVGGYVSSQNG
jgi:hypothetical protein